MSFIALIDDPESKSIWCRSIVALASISDQIQFAITQQRVTLSAINIAHTSHGEITFDKLFFKNLEFTLLGISVEDLSKDDHGDEVYSFSLRSKILSILFRKMEDDIESYKLSFHAGEFCSVNERYRLQIEMKTKSMIRKQYNPFYQPCKIDKLGVSKKYKEALLDVLNNDRLGDSMRFDDNEMNYLMINNTILKGFLENISSTTEDFKLEINQKNFSITAFTKGIFIKEKEILKQPMAVNITFNTDELQDLKLTNNLDKQIIFRLKDFKTFLNLGGFNDFIEIWFKKPGDPTLFELNKNGVIIQFVQVTDGEHSHHLDAKHTRVIPKEKIKKRKEKAGKKKANYDHTTEMEKEFNEPLFVPDDDEFEDTRNDNDPAADLTVQDQPQLNTRFKTPLRLPRVPTTSFESRDDAAVDMDHHADEISWGDSNLRDQKISQLIENSKNDEKKLIKEAKIKYLNELKKRKIENGGEEDDELGPTQDVSKVKGLFD